MSNSDYTTRLGMVEHGSSAKGDHIARCGRVTLIVEQTPGSNFDIGDKIGWANDSEHWLGTIVTSERDELAVTEPGWHLAWVQYDSPGKRYHWRGRMTARDTRWYPDEPFVIEELP
jgi:hypothetical protein